MYTEKENVSVDVIEGTRSSPSIGLPTSAGLQICTWMWYGGSIGMQGLSTPHEGISTGEMMRRISGDCLLQESMAQVHSDIIRVVNIGLERIKSAFQSSTFSIPFRLLPVALQRKGDSFTTEGAGGDGIWLGLARCRMYLDRMFICAVAFFCMVVHVGLAESGGVREVPET